MPKLLNIATALLATLALTASPALAEPEPAKATADFQEAVFTPVAGVMDFEETPEGIKVTGEFKKGFTSETPADYQVAVVDGAEVLLDLSKDFQKIAEIEAAEVAEFTFVVKTKAKIADIRNEDVVVKQLMDVAAGIKVQAEIGRAKIEKI
ncbi:hypothetical protein [Lentzea sp. NPDC003310]|uniref:hypothetical protein n=1 Tax=Lentzea sp. NPDC003310 TaxID=3154447 RepID=UPI0033B9DB26